MNAIISEPTWGYRPRIKFEFLITMRRNGYSAQSWIIFPVDSGSFTNHIQELNYACNKHIT